jgi:hypothetical protein
MFYSLIFFALSLFQFQRAQGQSLQEISQLFRTTDVVPDVIPAFNPSVLLQVTFGSPIIPGQTLTPNGADLDIVL